MRIFLHSKYDRRVVGYFAPTRSQSHLPAGRVYLCPGFLLVPCHRGTLFSSAFRSERYPPRHQGEVGSHIHRDEQTPCLRSFPISVRWHKHFCGLQLAGHHEPWRAIVLQAQTGVQHSQAQGFSPVVSNLLAHQRPLASRVCALC